MKKYNAARRASQVYRHREESCLSCFHSDAISSTIIVANLYSYTPRASALARSGRVIAQLTPATQLHIHKRLTNMAAGRLRQIPTTGHVCDPARITGTRRGGGSWSPRNHSIQTDQRARVTPLLVPQSQEERRHSWVSTGCTSARRSHSHNQTVTHHNHHALVRRVRFTPCNDPSDMYYPIKVNNDIFTGIDFLGKSSIY